MAANLGFDVVDLHYEMRRHIGLRLPDGIHWNAQAHRKISGLLLHHICSAWHVILPQRISIAFGSIHTGRGGGTKSPGDSLPTGGEQRSCGPDSMTTRYPVQRGHGLADPQQRRESLRSSSPDSATTRRSVQRGHGLADPQQRRESLRSSSLDSATTRCSVQSGYGLADPQQHGGPNGALLPTQDFLHLLNEAAFALSQSLRQ